MSLDMAFIPFSGVMAWADFPSTVTLTSSSACSVFARSVFTSNPVSYTHLDVYKRQALDIDDLCKKISLRKYILRAIVVLLLLATIYTGYKMLLFYDAYLEAKDAIIHTEVTIIE